MRTIEGFIFFAEDFLLVQTDSPVFDHELEEYFAALWRHGAVFSLGEAFAIYLVVNFVWDSGRLHLPAFMLAFSTSIRIDSLMYAWVRYL